MWRRIDMRRFTRLTNAFSKKGENHAAAVAAGLSDHVWGYEQIAALAGSRMGGMRTLGTALALLSIATVVSAQTNGWIVNNPPDRVYVTVSIDSRYQYTVDSFSLNEGSKLAYRPVSGSNKVETFGTGRGDLHITVTRLNGNNKHDLYTVDCETSAPKSPQTWQWRERHYSSTNSNLKCSEKAEVVITVMRGQGYPNSN
jgi:hypothetical protein